MTQPDPPVDDRERVTRAITEAYANDAEIADDQLADAVLSVLDLPARDRRVRQAHGEKIAQAIAEVERMRPVVEAALAARRTWVHWQATGDPGGAEEAYEALDAATATYEKEHTESTGGTE